jgi:hypothetical protein
MHVKSHRRYSGIGDFINCMVEELDESTTGFIALHIFVLFFGSLVAWMNFKIGG